jgi:hypothetical protein
MVEEAEADKHEEAQEEAMRFAPARDEIVVKLCIYSVQEGSDMRHSAVDCQRRKTGATARASSR